VTVDCEVPKAIRLKEDMQTFLGDLEGHLIRKPGSLEFSLQGVESPNLTFVPYFSEYRQRYGIYWYLEA